MEHEDAEEVLEAEFGRREVVLMAVDGSVSLLASQYAFPTYTII
jgi:hypothetical protein